MAKDDQIPSLVLLEVIDVERGISKNWHLHLEEEGHEKAEYLKGNASFKGIYIGDIIESLVIAL
jgi:hypothetical protein